MNQAEHPREVKALIESHLEEQRKLPESARLRDLGSEKALVRDYSGRVVYELLQNALDRAERRILVRWSGSDDGGGKLIVANDGTRVSAFDRPAVDGEKPSDLHSLLSLHSSTKSASESVGNKGVGFRSVFASSRHVRVYSRTMNGQWWGMRLDHPDTLPRPAPTWNSHEVASFYDPDWLEELPEPGLDDYVTAVCLDEVPPGRAHTVVETIRYLQQLPQAFLERRARFQDGRLHIRFEEDMCDGTLVPVHLGDELRSGHAERTAIPVPPDVKEATGLDLDQAEVRVLMLPEHARLDDAVYWSYLPTEQPSGYGTHVHADFYLNNSRRNVVFEDVHSDSEAAPSPGVWNGHLLQAAADLIVDELWGREENCNRADFWTLANPRNCACRHLRDAVTVRLLARPDRLKDLIRDGFRRDPAEAGWTVSRYQEFFHVLEAWVTEAYRLQWSPYREELCTIADQVGGEQQYKWRQWLRNLVRESGAPVIPIVDYLGEDHGAPVSKAMPLPAPTEKGKAASIRLYYRSKPGFPVPDALMQQRTYVTVFLPPHSKEPSEFGMLEFTRTELLANMAPGASPEAHRQLLSAAVRLAFEDPERGGFGSVAMRARLDYTRPLSSWRLATMDKNLEKAGNALARLFVPTTNGEWLPAAETVLPNTWPGRPVVDLDRLTDIAQHGIADLPVKITPEDVCAVFGIGGVPIEKQDDGTIAIAGWAETVGRGGPHLHSAARTLLVRFGTDIDCLIRSSLTGHRNSKLLQQLLDEPWLVEDLTEDECKGRLQPGEDREFPLAPGELWWQDPRRGFRTRLLPRIESETVPPRWAMALGVSGLGKGERDSETRPRRALDALHLLRRWHPHPRLEHRFDFEQTYSRLVEVLPDGYEGIESIPVLARRYDSNRTLKEITWVEPEEESVWHDTGEQSYALAAFCDYLLWVVRRGPRNLTKARGIKDFAPGSPEVVLQGDEDTQRREALMNRLVLALPDLFSVAALAPSNLGFDPKEATRRQATLTIRHAEDAYLVYTFDGREGDLGRDEEGDVFMVPEQDGSPAHIVFDGVSGSLPLVECARPLSDLLCDNRAFVSVFKDGLMAWAQAGEDECGGSSVRRFRRDHGISDEDTRRWSQELLAHRMSDTDRSRWQNIVCNVMSAYGTVKPERILPGLTIAPSSWERVLPGQEVTEEQLSQLLRKALTGPEGDERFLTPTVSFAAAHARSFRTLDTKLFVALAAQQAGRKRWNEEFYDDLQRKVNAAPSVEEEARFRYLDCNVERLMLARLGIDSERPVDRDGLEDDALAFARGQIPMSRFPDEKRQHASLAQWENTPPKDVREAASAEEWERKARRQTVGGNRAEAAVVALAMAEARRWQAQDPTSFKEALEAALAPFLDSNAVRRRLLDATDISSNNSLERVLHVSGYIGNAGFDVLVPRADEKRVQRVEVKRVTDHSHPLFHLSENERRQAIVLSPNWHLWLVSSDGRSTDASWVRDELAAGDAEVGALMNKGLRPSDWLFRLT